MIKPAIARQILASVLGLAAASYAGVVLAQYPVAGAEPDERLPGAPKITEFVKTPAWYDQALHGLEPPYPSSMQFLEDQGPWYTPFNHPGMTGPYDLRDWH